MMNPFRNIAKGRHADRQDPLMDPGSSPGKTGTRSAAPPGILERPSVGYVQTVETVRAINRALLVIVLIMVAAIVMISIALMSTREHITVYIPPDTTRANIVTAGTPLPAGIYGFASLTLQNLYHWSTDGQVDYRASIDSLSPYLTPAFHRQLLEDHTRLTNRGGINEISGRTRSLFPLPDRLFTPDRVVRDADGVWFVTLDFRLVETIEAAPIKDIVIRYDVRVVRADVDPTGNVWGMQLDGFLREPVRISIPEEES